LTVSSKVKILITREGENMEAKSRTTKFLKIQLYNEGKLDLAMFTSF